MDGWFTGRLPAAPSSSYQPTDHQCLLPVSIADDTQRPGVSQGRQLVGEVAWVIGQHGEIRCAVVDEAHDEAVVVLDPAPEPVGGGDGNVALLGIQAFGVGDQGAKPFKLAAVQQDPACLRRRMQRAARESVGSSNGRDLQTLALH
jgi:hypothetical protein